MVRTYETVRACVDRTIYCSRVHKHTSGTVRLVGPVYHTYLPELALESADFGDEV